MKCQSCAAELKTNTTICPYCGSKNEIDLKGIHEFTTVKPESERTCPTCAIPLHTIDITAGSEHFYIEQCDRCMGYFFDHGELAAILNGTIQESLTVNYDKLNTLAVEYSLENEVVYKKCPVCSEFMNRKNFGTRSGVVVDICKDHGIWLDGGELKKLMEWKKAGGQLLHEERKEDERRREERKAEKRKAEKAAYMSEYSSFSSSINRSQRRRNELTLGDIGAAFMKLFR